MKRIMLLVMMAAMVTALLTVTSGPALASHLDEVDLLCGSSVPKACGSKIRSGGEGGLFSHLDEVAGVANAHTPIRGGDKGYGFIAPDRGNASGPNPSTCCIGPYKGIAIFE